MAHEEAMRQQQFRELLELGEPKMRTQHIRSRLQQIDILAMQLRAYYAGAQFTNEMARSWIADIANLVDEIFALAETLAP